ncbi:hypothetical protein AB8O53_05480 [Streptomyces pilosus]
MEKPLCLSLAVHDLLREAEQRSGGQVLEALPTLGHLWHVVVRRVLGEGRFGRLRDVQSRFPSERPSPGARVRLQRSLGWWIMVLWYVVMNSPTRSGSYSLR